MECVLFVDAGYLLAEAADLCVGTKRRSGFRCDYPKLIEALKTFVREHAKMPLLRVYWYDGARDAVPTADHQTIAEQPYVKLRLGRLSGNKQKGVDALIFRDMLTLARERAMSRAYLLSGDEDLREAVAAVQDLGVQVVLVGVAGTTSNQSSLLRREADECLQLEKGRLEPCFARIEEAALPVQVRDASWVEYVGTEFGWLWAEKSTVEDLQNLLKSRPRIPTELDTQLLRFGEQRLQVDLRQSQELRRLLRKGFWKAIDARRGAQRV